MKRVCVLLMLALAIPSASWGAPKKNKKPDRGPDAVFKKLDKNNDHKLTADELKSAKAKGKGNDKQFQRIDKNKDGGVSLEEFKKRAEGRKAKAKK